MLEKVGSSNGMVIAIVYLTLMIDNMILTSVVSILPEYFYEQHEMEKMHKIQNVTKHKDFNFQNSSYLKKENVYIGILFASKPIVQILFNMFVGPLVDRIGFDVPMFCGYIVLTSSCLLFAFGKSYVVLLVARAIQGIGSSFASTAGISLLADRFVDDCERGKALGHAIGGLAMGVLLGPTFGSIIYSFAGKSAVFFVLSGMTLVVAMIQVLTRKLKIQTMKVKPPALLTLLKDPYILLAGLSLVVANSVISMIETGMPIWMIKTMKAEKWQFGVAFLPMSISYMVTTYMLTCNDRIIVRWSCCMVGTLSIGVGVLGLSFVRSFYWLFPPNLVIGMGVSLVDNMVFPIMGLLVDTRHLPIYGSVFAITDAALCAAFAVGPLAGGALSSKIGFPWTMRVMSIACLVFAPFIYLLRKPTTVLQSEESKPILNKNYQVLKNEDSDEVVE